MEFDLFPIEMKKAIWSFADGLDRFLFGLTCKAYRNAYPFGFKVQTFEEYMNDSLPEASRFLDFQFVERGPFFGEHLAVACAYHGYLDVLVLLSF